MCVVSVCVTQRCFLSLSLSLSLVEIVLMFPLPPFFCRLLAGSMIPEQSRAEQRELLLLLLLLLTDSPLEPVDGHIKCDVKKKCLGYFYFGRKYNVI